MSLHFFDVGANVGQTFDDYLTKTHDFDGADVWCFEPSPRHLPALMAKAASLKDLFKIHICPFGLRGGTAIVPFYMKDDPRGDSFEGYLASDHVTQNWDPGFMLHQFSSSIKHFILENTEKGDRIVLKLDCEGSEYGILCRLLAEPECLFRITRILVEFHMIHADPKLLNMEQLIMEYSARNKPLERWLF